MPIDGSALRAAGASPATRDLVAAAARLHDPDRYLAALLAPKAVRGDLVTLASLTGELSRITRTVREPMLTAIRLQWWRDALVSGATTGYPVADEAIHLLQRLDIAMPMVEELTRSPADGDATGILAPDETGWREAGAADGAAFGIALRIAGVAASPRLDRTAALAGEAFGVARRLNEEGAGAAARAGDRLALPAGPWIEGVKARREEIRRQLAAAPGGWLVALLPLALIEPYLRSLQVHEGGGVRATPGIAPLARAWCLWRAKLRRRI